MKTVPEFLLCEDSDGTLLGSLNVSPLGSRFPRTIVPNDLGSKKPQEVVEMGGFLIPVPFH